MARKGGSGGAREAIQTLSSILSDLGMPRIPSEVFRQAKFDHPSSFNSMVHLLYRSVSILKLIIIADNHPYSYCPSTELIISSVPKELPDEDWMLLIVQKFFFQLGYSRLSFYRRSCDGCSSRDLLLGFGWIVSKCNLMGRLKSCVVHSAKIPSFPMKRSLGAMVEKIGSEYTEMGLELKSLSRSLEEWGIHDDNLLQKLVFINGRLSKQFKILNKSIASFKKLERKVSAYVEGGMGLYEAYLSTHSESYLICMKHLERHISLLTLFIQWEGLKPAFSKWLESVLELDEKEKCSPIARTDELKIKVTQLQTNIDQFIRENKGYIENVDKLKVHKHTGVQAGGATRGRDSLTLAMNNQIQPPLTDLQALEMRICLSSDCMIMHTTPPPDLEWLKKEVEKRRVIIQKELQSLQELVPNSINVMFTRTS